MSVNHDFYVRRAAEAGAEAAASNLDNVKQRWLRSQASWTQMADRVARAEEGRIKTLEEKAERLLG